jgi:CubicO group peptidase (beta-lactamase class C family)
MRLWLAIALFGCSGTNTTRSDSTVATIATPDGWSAVRTGSRATFTDPENALRVVITASDVVDANSAIAHAWMRAGPAMLAAPSSLDEPPPSRGWDAQATIEYSVREGRSAWAQWRRLGATSYVVLVDGDANAIAKREAQIATLVEGVKPPGLRDEKLAGPTRVTDGKALDEFVDRALRELDVPGAAIAVAVDGNVVYLRTAGVKEKGKAEPITEDTRFLLASLTKPLTTMMQAALVDAKVVRWEQPITELLPTFALGDPEITKQLQLWHMSCACTGMPRQDMEGLFEWKGVSAEARIDVMKTMKPTTKLGETFQYSNPLLAAGGFIAGHAHAPQLPLFQAYASAMQDRVFDPIGMASTTFDFAKVASGDHAMPHALAIDGETRVLPLEIERQVEPIAPAGGAWSTLRDMATYALIELREGQAADGTRVVSIENYRERVRPRIAVGDGSEYALGIDVETYRGQRLLSHDGGSFGFGTRMWVMPDAKVAIVILTNVRNGNAKEQLPFVEAVSRRIVEALFASAKPLAEKQLAYFVKLRHREPYVPSNDRSWIARLVGRYHEPVLGDVEIRATENGAVFDAGEWKSAMDVVVGPDGTARTVMLDPPFAGAGVVVGPGDPPTLIVPDQTTYTFTRVR